MAELLYDEDPEPCEPGPAGPLFVPVRPGPAGHVARLFRTPVGGRTAVAFTTPRLLSAALGPRQPWIRLSEPALRSLAEPLGVSVVTVDPRLAAHPVGPPRTTARREPDHRPVGAPSATGTSEPLRALITRNG
ncbi:SAV_915 family protein [Streptomyces venezuelae]|uniref:SAV_915 family protein n=1 Tax=Streptomyces venezuelae TaxID=54571 RepID=UPI0034525508